MSWSRFAVGFAFVSVVLVACSGATDTTVTSPAVPATPDAGLIARLDAIGAAVTTWRTVTSVGEALIAAETAANLVVGPNGPGFGDRNGDGEVTGLGREGVLPGFGGTPNGLALYSGANDCIVKDIQGGSWDDPEARWDEMVTAIEQWRPNNNTMPSLASHPMRVVGWATFAQASDSLDTIREYAGHAILHVNISLRATGCGA